MHEIIPSIASIFPATILALVVQHTMKRYLAGLYCADSPKPISDENPGSDFWLGLSFAGPEQIKSSLPLVFHFIIHHSQYGAFIICFFIK